MKHQLLAASVLSTAVGLALAAQTPSVRAQGTKEPPQIVKDNMPRMPKDKLEKCYGINAAAKNDCAEGAHSCAGQATQARDTKSFVLLPGGDCAPLVLLCMTTVIEIFVYPQAWPTHIQWGRHVAGAALSRSRQAVARSAVVASDDPSAERGCGPQLTESAPQLQTVNSSGSRVSSN